MISERSREGNKLTMLESAGERTASLPVWNDKRGYGTRRGTLRKANFLLMYLCFCHEDSQHELIKSSGKYINCKNDYCV